MLRPPFVRDGGIHRIQVLVVVRHLKAVVEEGWLVELLLTLGLPMTLFCFVSCTNQTGGYSHEIVEVFFEDVPFLNTGLNHKRFLTGDEGLFDALADGQRVLIDPSVSCSCHASMPPLPL